MKAEYGFVSTISNSFSSMTIRTWTRPFASAGHVVSMTSLLEEPWLAALELIKDVTLLNPGLPGR